MIALLCILALQSSLTIFEEEQKAGCFAIIVLQMYCYFKRSVGLPHGAVSWPAFCDSGISWPYLLTIWY